MTKYTKEQLQAMSDFEANKALAELLGFSKVRNFNSLVPSLISVTDVCCGTLEDFESCVDYCNTPNDIMPLAFEHGISFDDGELLGCNHFTAYKSLNYDDITGAVLNANHHFTDANPLRAIACCLILILQEGQQ